MSYFFPGGGAIRSVGRIQIFMLMWWAIVLMFYLRYLMSVKDRKKNTLALIVILGFFLENTYRSHLVFSRAQEMERLVMMKKA